MLDIVTYLLGWTSGLFVGIAVGNYVRSYFQRIAVRDNITTIFKLLSDSGLLKMIMSHYGDFGIGNCPSRPQGVNVNRPTASTLFSNVAPTMRQEECDVPKPNSSNSDPEPAQPNKTTESLTPPRSNDANLTTPSSVFESDSASRLLRDIVNSLPQNVNDPSHTI